MSNLDHRGENRKSHSNTGQLAALLAENALSPDDALDKAILKSQLSLQLFVLAEADEPRKEPQFYEDIFGVNVYVDRAYAPIELRAKQLLAHEEAALLQAPNVKDEGRYRQITVNVQLTANIFALRKILNAIDNNTPYLFVDNLMVRSQVPANFRPGPGAEPEIFVQFDVSGFSQTAS